MAKREELVGIAAVILGAAVPMTHASEPAKTERVECFGINKVKADNACGLSKEQIDLANKVYANKFAKSTVNDCHKRVLGSAAEGYLGWVSKAGESECFKEGGFIFARNDKGVRFIKDKDGVKM